MVYPRHLLPENILSTTFSPRKFFYPLRFFSKNILSVAASLGKFIIRAILYEKNDNPQLHHFSQRNLSLRKSFIRDILSEKKSFPHNFFEEKIIFPQQFPYEKYVSALLPLWKCVNRNIFSTKKPHHFLPANVLSAPFSHRKCLIPKIFSKEIIYPELFSLFKYLSSIFYKKIMRIIFCYKIFHPHYFLTENVLSAPFFQKYILSETYSPRKSFMRSILSEKNAYPHLFREKKLFFLWKIFIRTTSLKKTFFYNNKKNIRIIFFQEMFYPHHFSPTKYFFRRFFYEIDLPTTITSGQWFIRNIYSMKIFYPRLFSPRRCFIHIVFSPKIFGKKICYPHVYLFKNILSSTPFFSHKNILSAEFFSRKWIIRDISFTGMIYPQHLIY